MNLGVPDLSQDSTLLSNVPLFPWPHGVPADYQEKYAPLMRHSLSLNKLTVKWENGLAKLHFWPKSYKAVKICPWTEWGHDSVLFKSAERQLCELYEVIILKYLHY